MKNSKALALAAAVALTPTVSNAGGFDLTGQPIDIIFEEGNYLEGRVGIVIPEVEGSNPILGSFGDNAESIPFVTLGAKTDFTDRISGAIIYDTPFLRETQYNRGIFEGTSARVEAETVTAIGRFKLTDNFSIYGGPRVQSAYIDLQGPFARFPGTTDLVPGNLSVFQVDVTDFDFGYVAGFAAEIPKYKIRASATYNSEVTHNTDTVETFFNGAFSQVPGQVEVTTPQSVNVDIQAPISTSTLVRANIRWVNWDGVNLTTPGFLATFNQPVVEFTDDTFTYRLTVAQRINDTLAAFVTGSYEETGDEEISLFKTTDGGFSIGGGIVVEPVDGLKLTLAGEYRQLEGLSGQQSPVLPVPSEIEDASAFGLSLKVGYSF